MKACYCDLCGTALPRTQFLYDIIDNKDRYKAYHHIHWNVCNACHEELVARREAVLEAIKNNESSNTPSTGNGMIELDGENQTKPDDGGMIELD